MTDDQTIPHKTCRPHTAILPVASPAVPVPSVAPTSPAAGTTPAPDPRALASHANPSTFDTPREVFLPRVLLGAISARSPRPRGRSCGPRSPSRPSFTTAILFQEKTPQETISSSLSRLASRHRPSSPTPYAVRVTDYALRVTSADRMHLLGPTRLHNPSPVCIMAEAVIPNRFPISIPMAHLRLYQPSPDCDRRGGTLILARGGGVDVV